MPLDCRIYEETWTDKDVNVNHLHIFDCISYVGIKLSHGSKLDSKFRRCVFIKYETDEYNYQFWDPEDHKILKHKDVVFNEKNMYKDLLMERNTLEKDPRVASRSNSEQ